MKIGPGTLVLLALLAASAATAEVTPEPLAGHPGGAQGAARPTLQKTAWALDPPVLYLVPRKTGEFLGERRNLMNAVIEAGDEPMAMAAAMTDLAEFHLAHGMAAEGLSILQYLDDVRMPPVHRLRAAALELALGLIDPRDRPLTEQARVLLEPKHAGWPDQVLFLAISRIRDGHPDQAGPILDAAVTRLARFPPGFQEIVLPGFLESAITTRQWKLARDLAAAFQAFPVLNDSPAYHYLLGQAAEAGNDSVAAFDSYARAMAGKDLWAHRARRALVDLGLRDKALSAEEAASLLLIERELWMGDDRAAQTAQDLAALQLVAGDIVSALETIGDMIRKAPNAPGTEAARQKAHALIGTYYDKGTDGQLGLSAFMDAHSRIAVYFRFDQDFADASERFADTFLSAGATTVAAREYATIHDYLTVAQDLGLFEVPASHLVHLKLREAEALLAGGQYAALADLLQMGIPAEGQQRETLDLIAAQYFSETGQQAEVIAAPASPSPKIMAIKAQAQFERGNWAAAETAYAEIWALNGTDMPFPEAINFLLSAYRNGNLAQTAALATEFPKLTTLPGWATIAESLSETAPQLLPLSANSARARVDNAQQTLEALPDVATTN